MGGVCEGGANGNASRPPFGCFRCRGAHPPPCRHEFGSEVAKKHGIHTAKEMLDHSSISVTQRYAHLTTNERFTIQSAVTDVQALTTPESSAN